MKDWLGQHEDWKGTATELAELAQGLLKTAVLDDVVPNERLVRNYTQLGVLERPVRSGKEAYYGPRQVIEFLVARKLVREGWPLAKVAEFNRSHNLADLLELLPEPRPLNEAEKLVARLHRETSSKLKTPDREPPPPPPPVPSPSFLKISAEFSKKKFNSREVLREMGNSQGEPERVSLTKLVVAPGCELLVDLERMRTLPPEALDRLGETIAQFLREEIHSIRRSKK
jgi:hypothetical protein